MTGAAPFDGVDLVLVTHNHPDHFDARLAVRYLEDLPDPLLLAPADAVAEMRNRCEPIRRRTRETPLAGRVWLVTPGVVRA